jgi:alpha-N-arabinofuranosidase
MRRRIAWAATALLLTAAAPAAAAELHVDATRLGKTIDPQVFGSNVTWNSQFDFMDPRTGRFYPRFLRQLAGIRYGALRFPGGTLASAYHWERAIGPQLTREPNFYWDGVGPLPSELGSDEFGELLDATRAPGTITVNAASGTVAEAEHWVAYMTLPARHGPVDDPADPAYWAGLRARHGHPQPYDVPWWEIGNEVNTKANAGWALGSPVSFANTHCATPNARACLYDFGGTTRFANQPVQGFADARESAAQGDGTVDQVRSVASPPVVPGTATVSVAGQRWTEVADLSAAGPGETVYRLEPGSGEIEFGDGSHGAIPPAGAPITASYDSGPHPGFVDFYRAMKAVNPAIHVCLGVSSDPPSGADYLHDLGATYPYDCAATHPYVRAGTDAAAGEIPNDLPEREYLTRLLALPAALADEVRALRANIDRYAGPRAAEVTIPLTEFGQLRSSNPDFAPEFHLSLAEGVLLANQLREWIGLGVPMAEHYLLAGSPFGSVSPDGNTNLNAEIVGPGPDTIPEAPALVEKLFRRLGGGRRIPVEAASVPAISGTELPALQAVGARSGRRLAVVVVNQSPDEVVTTSVTVAPRQTGSARVSTLAGQSPLAYNSPQDPVAVAVAVRRVTPRAGALTLNLPPHSVTLLELRLKSYET